jgi:hypothetical protein
VAQAEMRQRLNAVSMKKNEDPEAVFEQLSEIETIYNGIGKTIDQDDLVDVVLIDAPKDYHDVLTAEQRMKAHRGDALTLENLENAMHGMWHQGAGKHSKNDDEGGTDLSLEAFEGHCFKCGKKGHHAAQCENPATSSGGSGAGGGSIHPRFN